MWHAITDESTVPASCDLRLAVINDGEVHALVFPCRKTESGWARANGGRPVEISPTHWQPWDAAAG
jgi:hypothetical protein